MKLPFGKRVMCGNFYVVKSTRSIGSKELKKLRKSEGIPPEIQKHLHRGSLPYITISTVSDSWRIDFVVGMTMFDAINEIPVAMTNDGKYTYYGNAAKNLGNLINGWFAYTSTVGDDKYQADCITAMQDYLYRHSEDELTANKIQEEFDRTKAAIWPLLKDLPDKYDEEDGDSLAKLLEIDRTVRGFINKALVKGMNKEPLSKDESEKFMKEQEDAEEHRATLISMGNELQKGQ